MISINNDTNGPAKSTLLLNTWLYKGMLVGVTSIKSLLIEIERFVKFENNCIEFCILWNSMKINWYDDSKNLN